MVDLPEHELALRAQAGDESAEAELIERCEPYHRRLVRSRFGHPDYEDALQEARLGAVRAIRSFDPSHRCSFMSWRYVFSWGYVTNSHAVRTSNRSQPTEDVADLVPPSDDTPERAVSRKQLTQQIAALVAECREMDATDRVIFFQRLLPGQELPAVDVAKQVGLCRQQVYEREKRLMTRVLPKLFRGLRDAA